MHIVRSQYHQQIIRVQMGNNFIQNAPNSSRVKVATWKKSIVIIIVIFKHVFMSLQNYFSLDPLQFHWTKMGQLTAWSLRQRKHFFLQRKQKLFHLVTDCLKINWDSSLLWLMLVVQAALKNVLGSDNSWA